MVFFFIIITCKFKQFLFFFRICSVAGKEGHFLEPMSYVHVKRSTPAPAVALIVRFYIDFSKKYQIILNLISRVL